MRNIILLFSLTFSLSAPAQFNTIGRIDTRTYTKLKTKQTVTVAPSIVEVVDTIKVREEKPRLVIHPPLKGTLKISSQFGQRNNPFGGKGRERHNGLDLSAKAGTPIYAMLPGTVEAIGYDTRSGNYIKLRHGNFTVSYCHLVRKPSWSIGTHVTAGTPVANVGSTGRSTGPHLHITLKRNGRVLNPAILLDYL